MSISCRFFWKDSEASLARTFLFCINEKCLSGRVIRVMKSHERDYFQVEVSFIDSNYIKSEIRIGNKITIQEASKVLSEGVITDIIV